MRLAVISDHARFYFDGQKYVVREGFGEHMMALTPYFEEVTLCVTTKNIDSEIEGCILNHPKIQIVELPYSDHSAKGWQRAPFFLLKLPVALYMIAIRLRQWEIVHLRLPGYISLFSAFLCKITRKPNFTYIAGDWNARILLKRDTLSRRIAGQVLDKMTQMAIKDAPAFVLGDSLSERYKTRNSFVHRTVSSIISEKDIVDTQNLKFGIGDPAKILFVGRLERTKGLPYLLEAFQSLVSEGCNICLEIVGAGSLRPDLEKRAHVLGISPRVVFRGYVPFGSELLKFYREADVFVAPSLQEGQGKVFIEAMASGVPVIGTNVGGIPTIVKDGVNGLLVEPRSSASIVEAVKRVLNDKELRKKLILSGLKIAKQYTAEKVTAQMMNELKADLARGSSLL